MSEPQVLGSASDIEVAAVVAVLGLVGADAPSAPAPAASQWANPSRAVRSALDGGRPQAWRTSALPR